MCLSGRRGCPTRTAPMPQMYCAPNSCVCLSVFGHDLLIHARAERAEVAAASDCRVSAPREKDHSPAWGNRGGRQSVGDERFERHIAGRGLARLLRGEGGRSEAALARCRSAAPRSSAGLDQRVDGAPQHHRRSLRFENGGAGGRRVSRWVSCHLVFTGAHGAWFRRPPSGFQDRGGSGTKDRRHCGPRNHSGSTQEPVRANLSLRRRPFPSAHRAGDDAAFLPGCSSRSGLEAALKRVAIFQIHSIRFKSLFCRMS